MQSKVLGIRTRSFSSVVVLCFVAGCSLFDEGCDTVGRPAITVQVTDASTGADILPGTTIKIVDGEFVETFNVPNDPTRTGRVGGAIGRPGTYEVTVTKDGYQPWIRSNVNVTLDGCHVKTVALDAALTRE